MKAAQFVRLVLQYGRKRRIVVRFDARHGKGSHGRLYFGSRFTTVPDLRRELKTGTLHAMLRDLGPTLEEMQR